MKVFAHRGSSQAHPENTLEAFAAAIEEGASGIETDVQLTRDGRLVLVHDDDLRRVAGSPRRIAELTWQELRSFDVGGGQRVPALEELWELAGNRLQLNLEIKAPAAAAALVAFLAGRGGDVLLTSFHRDALERVRAGLPGVPAGPVLEHLGPAGRFASLATRYPVISLQVDAFTREAARVCAARGSELLLWVVNDPLRARELCAAGAAGVFTDCPAAFQAPRG